MRKLNLVLLSSIAALFMMLAVSSVSARRYASGYAEDRSQIEDLMQRYMFAIDFDDVETLASLFTEDGTLVTSKGPLHGRAAIRENTKKKGKERADQAAKDASAGLYPAAIRHFVSNIVLKIDGDKASGVAYWCNIGNVNPDRNPFVMAYGYYTDEFVKVDGEWFFKFRKFTNEHSEKIHTKTSVNPAP